jgi:hypothetical protein
MQTLFAERTDWHVPWLERVLPTVMRLAKARRERSVFTRFVPPNDRRRLWPSGPKRSAEAISMSSGLEKASCTARRRRRKIGGPHLSSTAFHASVISGLLMPSAL